MYLTSAIPESSWNTSFGIHENCEMAEGSLFSLRSESDACDIGTGGGLTSLGMPDRTASQDCLGPLFVLMAVGR